MSSYSPQFRDVTIIPDAFNTGLTNPELCVNHLSTDATSICGIPLRSFSDTDKRVDWNGGAKSIEGEFIIENYDFTEGATVGYTNGGSYLGSGVTIIFRNCKFPGTGFGGYFSDNRRTKLYNCEIYGTLTCDYGEIHNCHIISENGGDGCQSNGNILIQDTYIEVIDKPSNSQGGNHMDGFQDWTRDNIYLDNVRIECPWINYTYHKGAMNDAFYMEIDAPHCGLTNSVVAGGGIYMMACYKACVVDNCLLQRNSFYPASVNKTFAECTNTKITDSLYVSSVFKKDNKINIITTNDTFIPRVLKVTTNKGDTTFNFTEYWQKNNYEVDTKDYEDFPIDINCQINADGVEWLVCFDVTDSANPIQIRYVEFEPSPIEGYIDHIELNGTTYSIYDKEALHGNIVTTIDSSSSDNDIPTAKAVYDSIPVLTGKELISNKVTTISSESTDTEYPSARCLYLLLGDLEDRLEDI